MRRPVVVVGIVLLAISSFLLYFGLRMFFFPEARGQLQGGLAIAIWGVMVAVLGIVLIIWAVASKKNN